MHLIPLSANIGMLNLIFNQPAGQRMILQLSDRFSMEGVLVSVAQKADGAIQSFRFTPENFRGTSFVFSKTLDQNGSVVYHGFITGRYIKRLLPAGKENNRYYFIKKTFIHSDLNKTRFKQQLWNWKLIILLMSVSFTQAFSQYPY